MANRQHRYQQAMRYRFRLSIFKDVADELKEGLEVKAGGAGRRLPDNVFNQRVEPRLIDLLIRQDERMQPLRL